MKVLITAGGTGGHIMPAISIAEALRDKVPSASLVFVGTDRGLEEAIAKRHSIDFIPLRTEGLRGRKFKEIVHALYVDTKAFLKAIGIIRSLRPDWVIGTGGYITGIVVFAGLVSGARCAIQEQNTIPGMTNRILGKMVHRVFLGMEDHSGSFPREKLIVTGNPIRKEIEALKDTKDRTRANAILVMGGSLGASRINRTALDALKICRDRGINLPVIHQTGSRDYALVVQGYKEISIEARVFDFIDDMVQVYKDSTLAVCRAGAITLTELMAASLPAIMIPYPHAADNHQMENARYVASMGGGWIIPESELSAERLANEIEKRVKNKEGLEMASRAMGMLFTANGSTRIAEVIASV